MSKPSWYTARVRKPAGVKVSQPGLNFPQWVTGDFGIAEAHLLNRIASEQNPRLKIYGFDGLNWLPVAKPTKRK